MFGRDLRYAFAGTMLASVGLTACGGERDEARLLFDHLDAVDVSLDHLARVPLVDALQAVSLDDEKLSQMRETCVRAHRALIQAEAQQQLARRDLDSADAQAAGSVDEATAARVTNAIESSQSAFQQAKALFPDCERHKRSLGMRFSGRPGS